MIDATERIERVNAFIDELAALCGKHHVAIVVDPRNSSTAEIFADAPFEKLGELIYISAGRQGYTYSSERRL